MQSKRRILTRDFLIWGFFFLFIGLFFGETIREQVAFQYKTIKTYTDNFFASRNREIVRRFRPPHPISQEVRLGSSFGAPFASFQPADWDEFWSILYGVYPRGAPEEPGLPNTMRQLSEEELKDELIDRYERPFVNFRPKHWKAFFSLVFN